MRLVVALGGNAGSRSSPTAGASAASRPSSTRTRPRPPAELRRLAFAPGSMVPKVEAACRFAERTGGEAVIGALAELDAIARGEAETRVTLAAVASR